MQTPFNLHDIGWNGFFERHFEAYAGMGLVPARIAREDRGRYLAWSKQGEFTGEVTGAFRHEHSSAGDYPAVGDWVAAERLLGEEKVRIHSVLPRKTVFARTAAGETSSLQIAAANIDVVFLVSGLDHDFNLRRIERYLTLAYESGAKPVVLLNKADLAENLDSMVAEVEHAAVGSPVHAISALEHDGIDAVRQYVTTGVTAAFLGSSGVGKSTLINALLGKPIMPTSGVREDDSRGRHTTTHRQMVLLPQGGLLIDTPGMRELQMAGGGVGLSHAFAEIEALAEDCRFRDCSHTNEPGCAVRAAIETGKVDAARYAAYTKLQKEIAYNERRSSENYVAEERKRNKEFGKMARRIMKEKRNRR